MVFVSGSLGMDPQSNKLVDGGVVAEAKQSLKNIGAVLAAAGSSYNKVIKTTILLDDIADFQAVNEVYKECNIYSQFVLATVLVNLSFFSFQKRFSGSLHFSGW